MIATILNHQLLLSSNIKHKFTHRVNFSRNYLELSKTFLTFAARSKNVIEKMTSRRLRVAVYALRKEDTIQSLESCTLGFLFAIVQQTRW